MTKEFIQKDGLEGWVNEDGAWIEPPKQIENPQPLVKKIDRRILINNLMKEGFFNLFEELSKYLKDYPLLVEYTADGVLTQEELQALLGLLTFHKEGEVISQGLYDYLIQELKG